MATDSTRPSLSAFQAQTELELLHLIMQEENIYPWNPADPGSVIYFEALEQQVAAMEVTAEDLAPYADSLAAQLDQVWSSMQTPIGAPSRLLSSNILQQLSARIPQQFLEGIVQRAQQAVATNLSLADQLVMCVPEMLPVWSDEDLQVFARPFAYSMRGPAEADQLEGVLRSVRDAEWDSLTPVEQARLSLAIASYTLAQVEDSEGSANG